MSIEQTWIKHLIGDFSLWIDPLLPIIRRGNDKCEVLIVGDVFSLDDRRPLEVIDGLLDAGSWEALDCLGGRFAVLIISGGQCHVAHDALGSRSVFYLSGKRFAVASHAALLADAYDVGRSEDVAKLMQLSEFKRRTVKYLPGDLTVYQDIYALVPNNYLDSVSNSLQRYWPIERNRRTTLDDFYGEVDLYLSAFVPFVASRYEPIFGISGGVDSRAVFCAFRRYGIPFRGVTWRAPYLNAVEEPVVREIVSLLGIEHVFLDPRKHPSKRAGVAARVNSGNFRGSSMLTEAMAVQFGDHASAAFVRGWGGEIMRGFYNLRARPMEDLQAETLMRAYSGGVRGAALSRKYRSFCARIFDKFRERANYGNLEYFGYDPSDIFYWEHRMGMWGSAMLNEMDSAVYSLIGFNSRKLFLTSFGLPTEQRLTKNLLKEVVSRNDEELGAIPYE